MWPSLWVERYDIGSCIGKILNILVNRRYHQMYVKRLGAMRTQRFYDGGANGDIWDKMPIHDINMDPVTTSRVNRAHFLTQPCKVS
jgi:hypothetical protein